MSEEEEWKKLVDRKWNVFWKRYEEDYSVAFDLYKKISKRTLKMFEKTSPFYGEKRPGTFDIGEDGKLYSHEPVFLMLGAIGETILEERKKSDKVESDKILKKLDSLLDILDKTTEKNKDEIGKILRYLKYAIPELENLIECPFCKEFNPPDKIYCVHCQKEIIKEELNGKKER